jgi:hypothetical protein
MHRIGSCLGVAVVVASLALTGAACSSDDGADATCEAAEPGEQVETLRVPDDHSTIGDAVRAAHAGDLIVVDAGVYEEAVDVCTPNLTIRGVDRNTVILDGGFELENGVRVLDADGVVVENMTARNFVSNGFYWTGSDYFRGSYLTAYRNGDYGLYAFDAYHGQFDHSYGGGQPDAGVYVGECYRCDVLVDSVLSENNGLGYSGTNSGGDLLIVNSTFRNNRAGIVPNSGSYELCYPERETTIVGNLVYDNNNLRAPAIDVALLANGNGILAPGGVRNVIERNRIWNHERTGIGLVPYPEGEASDVAPTADEWDTPCSETRDDDPTIPEADCVDLGDLELGGENVSSYFAPCFVMWHPYENRVVDNVVEDSGVGDLAVGTLDVSGTGVTTATLGNCFSGNTFTTTAPLDLETLAPCDGTGAGDWEAGALDLVGVFLDLPEEPPPNRYRTMPVPGPQENMPGRPTRAPVRYRGPTMPDLASIGVPDRPDDA